MWTYDLAREQVPTLEHLRRFLDLTRDAGYNAVGLYLEHRFAFPSTPWAHGKGAVTPEMIRTLQAEYSDVMIIPFLNLLGHMEGFIYTENGRRFAEERFRGMQACPSKEEFVELAEKIVDDTLAIFTSEIIHLGGDETQQLAACRRCCEPLADESDTSLTLLKARLYARHFAPLARRVMSAGRRPAVWGDMLLEQPKAALAMPRETLVFDWQYFSAPAKSARRLMSDGFEVVCCPSLQTYNSMWMHMGASEANVADHIHAAQQLGAYGVCVTTWENALFGNYETLFPAIQACGEMLQKAASESRPVAAPSASEEMIVFFHGELAGERTHGAAAPVVKLANAVISQALEEDADLVRVEPTQTAVEVRFDENGQSRLGITAPAAMRDSLVNRLRLLAGMPAVGKRLAQKGQIMGQYAGSPFSFEVQTHPTDLGVRLTLRRVVSGSEAAIQTKAKPDQFILAYAHTSQRHAQWAKLIGIDLPALGGPFGHSQIRSSLKVRLLLQGNPFLAWLHHGDELSGILGTKALQIVENAISVAPDSAMQGVAGFIKGSIEFVRYAEQAHQAYASELPGVATSALAPARQVFDDLEKIARASHLLIGGSLADLERCKAAKEHVERVVRRIKEYGDGSLGYLPSFEHITHPKFVPHDQGAWWLINRWAHE